MRGVTLDWRFEALRSFSEAHLRELQDFHVHVKNYSEAAMVAWEQACEGVPDGTPAADDLIEERGRIEDLLARGQTLGILGLYAYLENYLDLVIEHLRGSGAAIPRPRGRESKLEKLRKQFCAVGIDLKKSPFCWSSLDQMREVRNCIAHTNGWVNRAFDVRLKKTGLTVRRDAPLGPPATDFERWCRLVSDTCQLIHSECSNRYYDSGLP